MLVRLPIRFVIAGTTKRITTEKLKAWFEHALADLYEHFTSRGHDDILEDCTITLIDKTDGAITISDTISDTR